MFSHLDLLASRIDLSTYLSDWGPPAFKKWAAPIAPIVLALVSAQVYPVREILLAEMLFLVAFVFLLALGGICYLLGVAGELGWKWIEEKAVSPIGRSIRAQALLRPNPLHPNALAKSFFL